MTHAVLAITLSTALGATLAAQKISSEYPWTGVWRMDIARSKFGNPDAKPHRDQWFKFETLGESLRFSERVVYADGRRGSVGYTGRFDGAEYRLTDPPSSEASVILSREGDDTLVVTIRSGGKTVRSYKMVASADRQTLTLLTGADTRVYARQRDRLFPEQNHNSQ